MSDPCPTVEGLANRLLEAEGEVFAQEFRIQKDFRIQCTGQLSDWIEAQRANQLAGNAKANPNFKLIPVGELCILFMSCGVFRSFYQPLIQLLPPKLNLDANSYWLAHGGEAAFCDRNRLTIPEVVFEPTSSFKPGKEIRAYCRKLYLEFWALGTEDTTDRAKALRPNGKLLSCPPPYIPDVLIRYLHRLPKNACR